MTDEKYAFGNLNVTLFRFIICDLDGTLCDDRWRRQYIERPKRNFHDYHSNCDSDEVIPVTKSILNHFASDGERRVFIFMTGRNELYRSETRRWLYKKDIVASETSAIRLCPYSIIMRKDDDFTPAPELKRKMIIDLFGSIEYAAEKVDCIIENDPRVHDDLYPDNFNFIMVKIRENENGK